MSKKNLILSLYIFFSMIKEINIEKYFFLKQALKYSIILFITTSSVTILSYIITYEMITIMLFCVARMN